METYYCILAAIFGMIAGSFSNVCILSIPKKENFYTRRSHCMSCGNELKWYDLIPVVSYIILKGKCRYCHEKISAQYPIIELLTSVLYVIINAVKGPTITSALYCAFTSALIVLAVIDYRTREIPVSINIFICIIGALITLLDLKNWSVHIIGAVIISGLLFMVFLITNGNGIGGGDIKLTFTAGLVLGWKCILIGFIIACCLGTGIHGVKMKLTKEDHSLSFGPYLAVGFYIALLWGEQIVEAVYGI